MVWMFQILSLYYFDHLTLLFLLLPFLLLLLLLLFHLPHLYVQAFCVLLDIGFYPQVVQLPRNLSLYCDFGYLLVLLYLLLLFLFPFLLHFLLLLYLLHSPFLYLFLPIL